MRAFEPTVALDIYEMAAFPTEQVWLGRPSQLPNGADYQRAHASTCSSENGLLAHPSQRLRLTTSPCCAMANSAIQLLEVGTAADYLLHRLDQAADVLRTHVTPGNPELTDRAWEIVVAAGYSYTGVMSELELFLHRPQDADASDNPQLHDDVRHLVQNRLDVAHTAFNTCTAEVDIEQLLLPEFLSYGPGLAVCMLDPAHAAKAHTFKVTAAEAAVVDVIQALAYVRGGQRRGPVRAMLLPRGVAKLIESRSFGWAPVEDDFDPARLPLLEQMLDVTDPEANSLEHLIVAARAAVV